MLDCASTPPVRGVEGRACASSTSMPAPPASLSPRSSGPGTSCSTSRAPGCRSWSTATAARNTRPSTTRPSRCSTELLGIPDTHQVLFLQGGASQQFAQVPMNFLPRRARADYVVTGVWSEKALDEAKLPRQAARRRAPPGRRTSATRACPSQAELKLDPNAAYVHIDHATTPSSARSCTRFPRRGRGAAGRGHELGLPVEADRRVASSRSIYAGRAEEHRALGRGRGAWSRKDFIAKGAQGHPQDLPLQHARGEQLALQHAAHLRDLPVRNVLAWIKEHGRPEQHRERGTARRASCSTAPSTGCAASTGRPVEKDSRSVMNSCSACRPRRWRTSSWPRRRRPAWSGSRATAAPAASASRAYNAVTVEDIETLVSFMESFAKANG